MNFTLSDDELILMISKKNEEALGLLFSFYEKKMRFEAEKFKKAYSIPILDSDDIYQEIVIHFMNAFTIYDYRRGTLYSFWIMCLNRDLHRLIIRQFSNTNDSRLYQDINDSIELSFEESPLRRYEFHDDISMYLDSLNRTRNKDNYLSCLSLWAKGYQYDEIAKLLNISIYLVNSFIRRGIEKIRLNNKIEDKSKKKKNNI